MLRPPATFSQPFGLLSLGLSLTKCQSADKTSARLSPPGASPQFPPRLLSLITPTLLALVTAQGQIAPRGTALVE
jgi:hypothetical protein